MHTVSREELGQVCNFRVTWPSPCMLLGQKNFKSLRHEATHNWVNHIPGTEQGFPILVLEEKHLAKCQSLMKDLLYDSECKQTALHWPHPPTFN